MAKKKKNLPQDQPRLHEAALEGFSGPGKKVIGIGIILLVLGFLVLTKADSMGRNWASVASPFLVVCAYIAIGLGIFL